MLRQENFNFIATTSIKLAHTR